MAYQVRNLDHFLKFRLTGFRLNEVDCIIVCSHSLLCKNNLNNFVILNDMHMGLESLESALKSTSFDTKITSIANWEHVEPENTIHCNGIV